MQQPCGALIRRDPEPDDQPPLAERVAERRQQHGGIRDAGGEDGDAVDVAARAAGRPSASAPAGSPGGARRVPPAAQNSAVNAADSSQPSSSSSTRTAARRHPRSSVRVEAEAGRLLRVARPDAEQVRALSLQRDLVRPGHRGDERDPWIAPARPDRGRCRHRATFRRRRRRRARPRRAAARLAITVVNSPPSSHPIRSRARRPPGSRRVGDAVREIGRTKMRAAVEKRQLGAGEHQILVAAEEADAIDDHADAQRRAGRGRRRASRLRRRGDERPPPRGGSLYAHRTSPTRRHGRRRPRGGCRARARCCRTRCDRAVDAVDGAVERAGTQSDRGRRGDAGRAAADVDARRDDVRARVDGDQRGRRGDR